MYAWAFFCFLALNDIRYHERGYTISFVCQLHFSAPQATVTISKSRSGPLYAGTEIMLTADISLSGVNGDILLDITWRRGNDVIIASDTRTTVSAVSGSGDNYTASLTHSPITISDSGLITVTVTVTVSSLHTYFTATATESLIVRGIYTCTSNYKEL